MFERTVSFWKRLLGRHSPAAATADVQQAEEERRVWVRYPADLQTTYTPAGHGTSGPTRDTSPTTRLSARVRNISLGGVSLSVDRPFEPGDLLGVELPGATEQSRTNVLACVVHVGPGAEGEWVLGCTFARELSEEDLQAFGARRVRHEPPDQRTWMRFATDVKATYQRVAEGDPAARTAKVVNLSASGVGLVVAEAVENGALLSVELHAGHGDFRRAMLACVVHVTAQGEEGWGLGCNFIRSLSAEDLKALL